MRLIDSLLKLLTAQGADVLVIPSADPPWLERKGEPRPLSLPPLGREMMEGLLEELLDPETRQRVGEGATVELDYALDGQPYAVVVEPRPDGPRLTVRPGAAGQHAISSPPSPRRPPPVEAAPAAVEIAPLRSDAGLDPMGLEGLLRRAEHEGASDILLSHGSPPRIRVAGEVMPLPGEPIDDATIAAFLRPLLDARARDELAQRGSVDLALRVRVGAAVQRYRANLFRQRTGTALALRPVRNEPPTLESLHLPGELLPLASLQSGLVLVTGMAGSGKSTTLVALVEHINRTSAKHVITLEDPIEYEYEHRRALVHQREVGVHVSSFSEGLRAALRESPDVILVGEMRDHATMAAALTAAETGHLVLSTLHAANATMALDRVIDCFPEHQQNQVRFQLSSVLAAIVTQRLLPARQPPQRVPAVELLRVNTAVAAKIREGRGHQIPSEIQKGRAEGMLSFEVTLAALVGRGLLAPAAALAAATDPKLMADHLRSK